jgi:hypothetical protein
MILRRMKTVLSVLWRFRIFIVILIVWLGIVVLLISQLFGRRDETNNSTSLLGLFKTKAVFRIKSADSAAVPNPNFIISLSKSEHRTKTDKLQWALDKGGFRVSKPNPGGSMASMDPFQLDLSHIFPFYTLKYHTSATFSPFLSESNRIKMHKLSTKELQSLKSALSTMIVTKRKVGVLSNSPISYMLRMALNSIGGADVAATWVKAGFIPSIELPLSNPSPPDPESNEYMKNRPALVESFLRLDKSSLNVSSWALDFPPMHPEPVVEGFYVGQEYLPHLDTNRIRIMPPASEPHERANATFLVLCRNSDLDEIRVSIRRLEDRFNHRYNYPYTFINDKPFT